MYEMKKRAAKITGHLAALCTRLNTPLNTSLASEPETKLGSESPLLG